MNPSDAYAPAALKCRQAGSGPAVLCLHSSGGSSAQWKALTGRLARGHRVIAPDFLGHAGSPAPVAGGGTVLEQDTAQVAAIAAAHGGVHVVGHSYGAAVALRLALEHPRLVRSMVLYEPVVFGALDGGGADAPLWQEITQVGRTIVMHARLSRLLASARLFVDYWSGAGSWPALGAARQGTVALRMSTVAAHFSALFGWQPMPALRNLRVPLLLVHGERTRRVAAVVAARLAEALPAAERLRIGGAGHMGPLTHAGAFEHAVLHFVTARDEAAVPLPLAA
jgi:pimeloyl-ACP methyl ester carboxylesterase